MNIIYLKKPENQELAIYALIEGNFPKEVGKIESYKGVYIFYDHLFNESWEDIDLVGLMYEIGKYYG